MPTETTVNKKPPDKKPPAPEPTLSATVDGALYALAIDRFGGRAFVGGSAGTIYELDLHDAAPRLAPRRHDAGYIGAMAIVGEASSRRELVVGRYNGSLAWLDLHDLRKVRTVAAHAGWISDLDVTPGMIPGGETLVSVGHDMLVKTWDARSGALRQSFVGHAAETPEGYASALYAVSASPVAPIIASGDRAGEVRVWDMRTGREMARLACRDFYTFDAEKRDRSMGGVRRLRFSPDGSRLAVAGIGAVTNVDGFVGPARLEVWDWRSGKRPAVLQDSHQAVLNDVRWTADGKHLVAAGGGDGGGLLIVWSIDDARVVQKIKLKGHAQRLTFVDGERSLVVAGFEGVQVWSSASLFPTATKPSPSEGER